MTKHWSVFVFYDLIMHVCSQTTDVDDVRSDRGSTSDFTDVSRAYVSRKTPLYHHCMMYAPDGQLLCTCDTRKAQWYINKGLGGMAIGQGKKLNNNKHA